MKKKKAGEDFGKRDTELLAPLHFPPEIKKNKKLFDLNKELQTEIFGGLSHFSEYGELPVPLLKSN